MKQIKTIYQKSAAEFDKQVNEALKDGWVLAHRGSDAFGFIAELERDVDKKCCDTCRHNDKHFTEVPCKSCITGKYSKWEAPDK